MNELKQALQTALEALWVLRGGGRAPPTSMAFDRAAAAIVAAEAALAQPDQDVVSAAAHDSVKNSLSRSHVRIATKEKS